MTTLNHRSRFSGTVVAFVLLLSLAHDAPSAFAWAPAATCRPRTATTRLYSTTEEKKSSPSIPYFGSTAEKKTEEAASNSPSKKVDDEVEATTEKYGLEAGLFKSMQQKEGSMESAKGLLKKYGIAYLATSIPLAIVSFAIFYTLVDQGVDVAALLAKVGIDNVSETTSTAGTAALAYAFHKAASPIRFPPTVILTPIVAKMIGKEPNDESDDNNEEATA